MIEVWNRRRNAFRLVMALALISMPAAYAESVMLTNPDEEDWVKWDSDPSHIRILADTLSDGIMASF